MTRHPGNLIKDQAAYRVWAQVHPDTHRWATCGACDAARTYLEHPVWRLVAGSVRWQVKQQLQSAASP